METLPLPLIQRERTNSNASQTQHTCEPFCEPGKQWNTTCQCISTPPTEDVSIKPFREPSSETLLNETIAHNESREILHPTCQTSDDEEQPLDCSAGPDQDQKPPPVEYPDYKPDLGSGRIVTPEIRHLTSEVECIPGPIPHSEQENMDTMLNAQMMSYSNTPHCQSEPAGNDTARDNFFFFLLWRKKGKKSDFRLHQCCIMNLFNQWCAYKFFLQFKIST